MAIFISMEIQLRLDASIYSVEAVEKATYRFIDRFAAVISREEKNILVDLAFDNNRSSMSRAILDDFKKELLDQNLRLKIKAETETTRNLILSYTFSKSGLQS
ncbi:MAG: His-Xaa-Ser system protein HxsD [bacterium]